MNFSSLAAYIFEHFLNWRVFEYATSIFPNESFPVYAPKYMYRSHERRTYLRGSRLAATRRLQGPLALHVYEEGAPLRATLGDMQVACCAQYPRKRATHDAPRSQMTQAS